MIGNRIVEAISKIAENLGGEIKTSTGNLLADGLEVIAEKAKDIATGGGSAERTPKFHWSGTSEELAAMDRQVFGSSNQYTAVVILDTKELYIASGDYLEVIADGGQSVKGAFNNDGFASVSCNGVNIQFASDNGMVMALFLTSGESMVAETQEIANAKLDAAISQFETIDIAVYEADDSGSGDDSGTSGGGLFVITAKNYDEWINGSTISWTFDGLDHTFDEIQQASASGLLPVLYMGDRVFYCQKRATQSQLVFFSPMIFMTSNIFVRIFTLNSDNSNTVQDITIVCDAGTSN